MCLHSCSYAVECHNNTRTCKDFNVVFTLFSTQFSVPSADTTYWCTQHYLYDIIKDIDTSKEKIYFYKVLRHTRTSSIYGQNFVCWHCYTSFICPTPYRFLHWFLLKTCHMCIISSFSCVRWAQQKLTMVCVEMCFLDVLEDKSSLHGP